MANELHTMEAIVRVYHVYKEIWYAAEVIVHLLRDQLIDQAIIIAMPLANRTYLGRENLHVGIYLVSLIFTFANQLQNRENWTPQHFPLYGTTINALPRYDRAMASRCETFMHIEINIYLYEPMFCILCHTISESMTSV